MVSLSNLSDKNQLGEILQQNAPRRVLVLVRDTLSAVDPSRFTSLSLDQALGNVVFPEESTPLNRRSAIFPTIRCWLSVVEKLHPDEMLAFVNTEVVGVEILKTYAFYESALNRAAIEAETAEKFPEATIQFRSWLNGRFCQTGKVPTLMTSAFVPL
ncbi:MAG UNVERIFIED_CONTAM: hypothetical protein LVT10_21295 [Anaerolineae bacterium]|jgi:hypothetical protein